MLPTPSPALVNDAMSTIVETKIMHNDVSVQPSSFHERQQKYSLVDLPDNVLELIFTYLSGGLDSYGVHPNRSALPLALQCSRFYRTYCMRHVCCLVIDAEMRPWERAERYCSVVRGALTRFPRVDRLQIWNSGSRRAGDCIFAHITPQPSLAAALLQGGDSVKLAKNIKSIAFTNGPRLSSGRLIRGENSFGIGPSSAALVAAERAWFSSFNSLEHVSDDAQILCATTPTSRYDAPHRLLEYALPFCKDTLRSMEIRGIGHTRQWKQLGVLKELRSLTLSCCWSMTESRLAALLKIPRLEELRVDHDPGPEFLSTLPKTICRVYFRECESLWLERYMTLDRIEAGLDLLECIQMHFLQHCCPEWASATVKLQRIDSAMTALAVTRSV